MTLYIKHEDGTTTAVSATIMAWDPYHHQWSPDFFQDAETSVREGQEITPEDWQQIVDYWTDQADSHNAGEYTEQFGDPNGIEYGFFAE